LFFFIIDCLIAVLEQAPICERHLKLMSVTHKKCLSIADFFNISGHGKFVLFFLENENPGNLMLESIKHCARLFIDFVRLIAGLRIAITFDLCCCSA